ncbi:MAG TPA: aldehyde dehydrogenase family protein [Pseudonocardia sp.]|nr:aldehyde dehydrogenase family protein [Pseudonocardia sp.]
MDALTPHTPTLRWSYAPAPESAALANLRPSYRPFVDGEFVDGGGEPLKTVNPATEEVLAEVGTADESDVDRAVAAARRAFEKTWGPMPGTERARELAVLETLDNGKPIRESRDVDVPTASAHLFHHAGWADKLGWAGLSGPGLGPDPQPLGVVGAVIPWNFPLLMAAWKIAPALACGNTIVLKPAETTPLTALVLAEIAAEAGLPAGVLNVLPGAGDVGSTVVGHSGLDKVAFTGSTEVGKQIQRRLAGSGRRLTLELGGKAANIVYDDAPLDQAIEGVIDGIFFNQGHVCCAGSRLLVQESIAEEFGELLRRRIETLRVGDPLDKNTDVGAINSAAQLARIVDLVAAGDAEGARRWTSSCPLPGRGLFFPPTLFTDVEQTMRVAREEIFGPVLTVLTFRTPDEAVAKANNTPYGLSAGVWTEKGSKALWTVQRLRAGVVWTNTFNRFDPTAPFGGYRESGFGREGGVAGLAAYLAV